MFLVGKPYKAQGYRLDVSDRQSGSCSSLNKPIFREMSYGLVAWGLSIPPKRKHVKNQAITINKLEKQVKQFKYI